MFGIPIQIPMIWRSLLYVLCLFQYFLKCYFPTFFCLIVVRKEFPWWARAYEKVNFKLFEVPDGIVHFNTYSAENSCWCQRKFPVYVPKNVVLDCERTNSLVESENLEDIFVQYLKVGKRHKLSRIIPPKATVNAS